MRDPYAVLGVPRSVSEKELKAAYRKLAKANHPDQNQSDPKAQQKFAEISAAYDFLSDKDKKGAFDRGEIDADGSPKFAGFGGAGMGGGRRNAAGANFSAEDILKEFMSGFGGAQQRGARGAGFDPFANAGGFAGGARQPQAKGEDTHATVAVSLAPSNDSACGSHTTLTEIGVAEASVSGLARRVRHARRSRPRTAQRSRPRIARKDADLEIRRHLPVQELGRTNTHHRR